VARYAFGDGAPSARRLGLVAEAFEPSSRAFLARFAGRTLGLAVDLGCGPGHTTLLVDEVLHPRRTVGLDQSATFLELARAMTRQGTAFLEHDVTTVPFPESPADLAYCRFLMTHLPEPAEVLAGWASQLAPGGLLLLDEVEEIRTDHPVLRAYLDTVARLLSARGHRLEVGHLLESMTDPGDLRRVDSRTVPLSPRTRLVGEMFGLNLTVWRHDPLVAEVATQALLDEIAAGLDGLAAGGEHAAITWRLRQLAFERPRRGTR
jgi:SAM-dependent methyltransferase